jgi:ParB family chromosome partitioning protein
MTPEPPRRLGRGLDALLARKEPTRAPAAPAGAAPAAPGPAVEEPNEAGSLRTLPLSQIRANPYQPRQEFRPEELADLEASLRVNGLLQPITVRPAPNGQGYELIAGERRFRAATRLGWTEIPALVKPVDDRTLLTLAMIENLQRADLDPIEEADGYQRLIDEFALTNQEVADVVGKDRSTVANALRLRQLPASVRRMLQDKQLTAGHARALLPLGTERAIVDLAREIVANQLSVREVERRVQVGRPKPPAAGRKSSAGDSAPAMPPGASGAVVRQLEEKLRRKLQTGVSISLSAKDKGEVRIAFFSNDDLERLLELLGVSLD